MPRSTFSGSKVFPSVRVDSALWRSRYVRANSAVASCYKWTKRPSLAGADAIADSCPICSKPCKATAQGLIHMNEAQSTKEATYADDDGGKQSHGGPLHAIPNGHTVHMHNYFAGSLNSLPMHNVWRNSMQAASAASGARDMNSSTCGPKGEGLSWLPPGSGFYFARAQQPMSLPQSCSACQPKDVQGNALVPLFPKICRPTAYYAPRPKDEDELRRKPKFFQEKHGSLTVSSQSAFHSTHGYPIQV